MGTQADAERKSFEQLVAEAEAAPIMGWDFSWIEGRDTAERPSWRYSELVADRYRGATRAADLEGGGGDQERNSQRHPASRRQRLLRQQWPGSQAWSTTCARDSADA